MKIFKYILTNFCIISMVSACGLDKVDNFDGPDASLSGSIIDAETNELVQTDVIEGTTIKIIEHGYDPVTPQYLRVKNDGTYSNTMLFKNTYTVQPDQRNFFQIDEQEIEIKNNTILDFKVIPYVRISNLNVTKVANTVIATFNLSSSDGSPVKTISMFASNQPTVGNAIYSAISSKALNILPDPNHTFTLTLNVAKNSAYFTEGKDYYFRVGALSSIGGAKYNYAAPVKLNIGEFVEEPETDYYYLDRCESTDGWAGPNITLDSENAQEGDFCVSTTINGDVVFFQKQFGAPLDASKVSMEHGYFAFDLYISDTNALNLDSGDGQIEISSSGTCDQQELNWVFKSTLRLQNGWNHLSLKLSDAGSSGNINLSSVNWFRLYHTGTGSLTVKIDNLRFYEGDE
ncbi:MAG: DUF3823 domain-containing protein [Bacteroidales bacterium]|nr:DUF3823 domain-containing protein [Bacteroidales bacterium]